MLTDAACRNATCPPDRRRIRLFDGGGLYLEARPNGGRYWFWKYLAGGKEKRLALGVYPEITAKEARSRRDEARLARRSGADPVLQRKADKLAARAAAGTTFEALAREFHATMRPGWSASHAERWISRMTNDLFPYIGAMPVATVTGPMLLQTIRRIEARGAVETAHKALQCAGQVFRYAVAHGQCERDPTPDLREALRPMVVTNMAAVTEPAQAGALLRAVMSYAGQPVTRAALQLSALVFQRPFNVRAAEWSEIDLDAAIWRIPSQKMKRRVEAKINGAPHLVPLATQAVAILRELQPLTGHGRYVFPGLRDHERPMSDNTINGALRRMGYSPDDMTAHGFRALARTLLVQELDVDPQVVEAQLAHGKSGPLGSAYDRAEFMAQRRQMMQRWADYLDTLRDGAQVLPLKAA